MLKYKDEIVKFVKDIVILDKILILKNPPEEIVRFRNV